MTYSILTIGYGNLPIQDFIQNLKRNKVQAVIDIRSYPYSRFQKMYNRKPIKAILEESGIGYKFMGGSLGGRPKSPELLTNEEPDYNKIRKTISYQQGLDYLEKALEFDCRIVLLCACGDYQKCHRYNLVGKDLERMGYEILHIQRNGSTTQDKRLF